VHIIYWVRETLSAELYLYNGSSLATVGKKKNHVIGAWEFYSQEITSLSKVGSSASHVEQLEQDEIGRRVIYDEK